MRILDEDNDKTINRATIYLTSEEAKELRDRVNAMLSRNVKHDHEHLSDENYQREVTIMIYDPNNIDPNSSERYRRIIIEDK